MLYSVSSMLYLTGNFTAFTDRKSIRFSIVQNHKPGALLCFYFVVQVYDDDVFDDQLSNVLVKDIQSH